MNSILLIGYSLVLIASIHFAFAGFCFFVSGANVLRKFASLSALFAALYCLSVGLAYIAYDAGNDYSISYRLGWLGWFCIATFLVIALKLRRNVSRTSWIFTHFLFWFWGIVNILNVTTDLVDIEPSSFLPFHDRGGPLEMPIRHFAAFQLLWLFYQLYRARVETHGIKRQQTGYLLLGISIFAAGGFIISSAPTGELLLDPGLTSFFSLPWIALTIYAVTKHRLFDIRIVLLRIISATALTVIFASFHIVNFRLFNKWANADVSIILACISTALLGFATPLAQFVFRWTSGFFQKTDYQTAMKQSSEALISLLNLEDLIRRFIQITRNTFGVDKASFFLAAADTGYQLRWTVGMDSDENVKIPSEAKLVEWLQTRKQILVMEEQGMRLPRQEFEKLTDNLPRSNAELVAPVIFKGGLTGFLALGSKKNKDAFFQEDIDFLETLSSQVALAIENSRLLAESTTDGLTGLYHQKYFKARLKSEFLRATRHGHGLVLLLVDIDHFKKINDTHGHLMGDSVLKDVAKLINSSFRIEDVVARYGGEEFAVLLTESHTAGARESAERIRKRVEAFQFEKALRVTCSIGMYAFDRDNSDCKSELDIIERADNCLYKAKNSGRNQVVVFEEISKMRRVK